MNDASILVFYDKKNFAPSLGNLREFYPVLEAGSVREAAALLENTSFSMIIASLYHKTYAMRLLLLMKRKIKTKTPPILFVSEDKTILDGLSAAFPDLKYDFLKYPFEDLGQLKRKIEFYLQLIQSGNEGNNLLHSNFDDLTGLPNRYLFYDRLKLSLAHAKNNQSNVAVLILDIDHYKRINDSMGHDFGNLLLKYVAERLKTVIRDTDTVARIGGDEFFFIVTEIYKPQHVLMFVQKIRQLLEQPFIVRKQEIYITASIGISMYPLDGTDMDFLVKNAETAMYRAKNYSRNTYQLYTPAMNAKAFEQLTLENSLRKAIQKGEIVVFYQPRVNVLTGKIAGAEALARWQHPDIGLITPDSFIPLAEESGLIIPLGEKVMEQACLQFKLWEKEGEPLAKVAINLSAKQFRQKNLFESIENILKSTGMDPVNLELEITESIAVQNIGETLEILYKLKKMGIKIALDDFGKGYSSLSYLKKFPFDILKIDQAFIKDITVERHVAAIIKAIIEIARGLDLEIVAEGVETLEQLKLLASMGCQEMQGYLFSTPLPQAELSLLLRKGELKIL